MRVIIFLWRVFSLFILFLIGWEFWLNSLQFQHLVKLIYVLHHPKKRKKKKKTEGELSLPLYIHIYTNILLKKKEFVQKPPPKFIYYVTFLELVFVKPEFTKLKFQALWQKKSAT